MTASRGSLACRVVGAITLEYAGQQVFDTVWRPAEPVTYVVAEEEPPTVLSVFQAMRQGGPGHSWWRVVDVDESKLDPELLAGLREEIEGWRPSVDVGLEESWYPHSYTSETCDPNEDPMRIWNGESRVPIVNHGIRSRAIVRMGDGDCSGVLLGEGGGWVLTAAHCVWNGPAEEWKGEPEYVLFASADATLGLTQGFDVSSSLVPDEWQDDYNTPGKNDWALLKLNAPIQDASWMDIYGGANATFLNLGEHVHIAGFPSHILGSNGQCEAVSGPYRLEDAEAYEVAPLSETRLHSDGTGGQSGGPYFFCPGGTSVETCEPGERGEVITIHSGWRWGVMAGSRHVDPTPGQWMGRVDHAGRPRILSVLRCRAEDGRTDPGG